MQFDTGPALEALGHPTFVHEGLTYHGRHISLPEWIRYVGAVDKLQANELGMVRRHVLYRELLNKWFPPPKRRGRWPFRRRGVLYAEDETGQMVRSPYRAVADIVLGLELAIQNEAMAAFFRSQARAFNPRLTRAQETAPPSAMATTASTS